MGDEHMWYAPVTSCAWFNQYGNTKQPAAEKIRSTVLPVAREHIRNNMYTQEPERKGSAGATRRDRDRSTKPYYSRSAYPTPAKPYTTNRYTRQASGSSPPYSGSSIDDLEKGGMLNPKSTRRT
jgi:hypothetical protein